MRQYRDGGTFIYHLWKGLLHKWLSEPRATVYIVTPFLDTGKLKDICRIVLGNPDRANIGQFYVRRKCDDPLEIMDIIRNSTAKFSLEQKCVIKKKVVDRMMCDFTTRFHCKFIACVWDSGQAEVLITSANFTRQHFNCSNAETVFYQEIPSDEFNTRFLQPLEALL